MFKRHVTHLLTRYVHGQLRPAQAARVMNHVRNCDACRAALVREERVALDVQRELPVLGRTATDHLSHVWAGVWQEVSPARPPRNTMSWLPGLGVVMAVLLVLAVALPLLIEQGGRASAAPMPALPFTVATASPTPGVTDDASRIASSVSQMVAVRPAATVAFRAQMGASPVPMPQATVSPEVRRVSYNGH